MMCFMFEELAAIFSRHQTSNAAMMSFIFAGRGRGRRGKRRLGFVMLQLEFAKLVPVLVGQVIDYLPSLYDCRCAGDA